MATRSQIPTASDPTRRYDQYGRPLPQGDPSYDNKYEQQPDPYSAQQYDPYTNGVNGAFQSQYAPTPAMPQYDAGGPPQYSPNLATEDPAEMARQDRTSIYDRGNRIDQDYRDEIQRRYGLEEGYRGRADSAYDDLYGNPGYTPDEQRNIVREDELTRYNLTPEQAQGFQLTNEEQAGIRGNPGSQYNWFNPEQTEGIANETGGNMDLALDTYGNQGRGAWSGMSENTRGAIGAANLLPTQDYMDQQDNALNTGGTNIRGAFDSGEGAVRGAYGEGLSAVRGFTGNEDLGVSGDFMENYQFSDADADNMKTAAATSVGNLTRARQDAVNRAAAQSGYNSPMAMAAGYQELSRTGDADAADARLNAEVQAKRLGLDVTRGREDTRLGAEQYRAGLGAQSELGLLNNRTSGELGLQRNRIVGEQGLMDSGLRAAGEREGYRSTAENRRMLADLQNEQYLGNSLMDFETQYGRDAMTAAERAGVLRQNANQFNQTTGIGLERDIDEKQSDRNRGIATNRQATDIGSQNTVFNQNRATNNDLATRYGIVADARRGDQQTARNYWSGQSTQQGNWQGQARQGRTSNYGVQTSGANSATGNSMDYKTRNPSFGRTFTQELARGSADWLTGGR
jgi:hypothetical protein